MRRYDREYEKMYDDMRRYMIMGPSASRECHKVRRPCDDRVANRDHGLPGYNGDVFLQNSASHSEHKARQSAMAAAAILVARAVCLSKLEVALSAMRLALSVNYA